MELEREYARNLRLALRAARPIGLRLYPLGTYPLPLERTVRDGLDYRVQVHTIGPECFVDAESGIAATAPAAARGEVLNLYNLATALDPALVALTRSCPYYEGRGAGQAVRTVHYRGSAAFGWDGVYEDRPQVGALLPYADDAEHLVARQFDRYRPGVERRLFAEADGDLLRPAWNPVRLNRQGTLELHAMDSNYPEVP